MLVCCCGNPGLYLLVIMLSGGLEVHVMNSYRHPLYAVYAGSDLAAKPLCCSCCLVVCLVWLKHLNRGKRFAGLSRPHTKCLPVSQATISEFVILCSWGARTSCKTRCLSNVRLASCHLSLVPGLSRLIAFLVVAEHEWNRSMP